MMRCALPLAVVAALLSASTPLFAAPAGTSSLNQLDANGDGLLSKAEANAVPSIGDAYDWFDTGATIQQPQQKASSNGITLDQFEAGMQAAGQGGAFGPSVSGGNHYLQYPDGSRDELNTSKATTP